ncbi:beta-galactosidase-1-like protein 2 [Physella acuta]|uniref:beta-galactosidase-1-like protein 2 n=1 Tax=Physella acuta TaxID=109671 RepID=UPI0027DBF564|nr:beta-galactosidase-1-like protein 2 [Physella acuta]
MLAKIKQIMRKKTILRMLAVVFVAVVIWIVWFVVFFEVEDTKRTDIQFKWDFKEVAPNPLSPQKFFPNDESLQFARKAINPVAVKNLLNGTVILPDDYKSVEIQAIDSDMVMNSTYDDVTDVKGLTFYQKKFYLNNRPFRIFSGAVHYFRILRDQWEDRLMKLKACGLNTVETYVPWNLHEPSPGEFNFEDNLDLRSFLSLASTLGLFVILRPGPYICAEFDFGGLPGWLLRDPDMKVRSNYPGYISAVNKYFSVLFPLVHDLQFTEGGPIIMFQVENEFSSYTGDVDHLKLLVYMMKKLNVKELLVTSDHMFKQKYAENKYVDFSQYALLADNLGSIKESSYNVISELNPHFPYMVMELWSGWFDYWGQEKHSKSSVEGLRETLNAIMHLEGSFNLYMFIGGTNFGFTSGANNFTSYRPMVTSYDYDAILTEAGDITPKYHVVRSILHTFYKTLGYDSLPSVPFNTKKGHYGKVPVTEVMEWDVFITLIPIFANDDKVNYMETYTDADNKYNTLGYIVYSHQLGDNTHWNKMPGIQTTGVFKDRLTAILNGETFYVQDDLQTDNEDQLLSYNWDEKFQNITRKLKLKEQKISKRLDLMVENLGRVNFSPQSADHFNHQQKGLRGPVFRYIFGILEEWNIRMINFSPEQSYILSSSLTWRKVEEVDKLKKDLDETDKLAPALYRAYLHINNVPMDTFLNLDGWVKGVVIVNNFNLGRYWCIGPQKTLYVPAPILKYGRNEILIFEEFKRGPDIFFQNQPNLG